MLELWYQALSAANGIKVRCSDRLRVIQKLYHLRQKAEDEDLKGLSIVQSPTAADEIWIIKNRKKL